MKAIVSLLLGLGLAALAAPGCNSSETALCDAECDCKGCSARDYDNCLSDYDRDSRDADYRGCEGFYDDLITCREDTYVCRGTDFSTSCKTENDRFRNCIK